MSADYMCVKRVRPIHILKNFYKFVHRVYLYFNYHYQNHVSYQSNILFIATT